MTKVVAIEKGYFRKRRNPGDEFNVPFSKEVIEKSKWLALPGEAPEKRVIPMSRNATMVDVLKGLPEEEDPETMSAMTKATIMGERKDSRAYGLTPEAGEQPYDAPPKVQRTRKTRNDKGKKRGPRSAPKAPEVTL